jgi:hypothetical protein
MSYECEPHNAISLAAGAANCRRPSLGAEKRLVHFDDSATVLLREEVQNAIVDNAVGGYIPPCDISETRPEKPQGS